MTDVNVRVIERHEQIELLQSAFNQWQQGQTGLVVQNIAKDTRGAIGGLPFILLAMWLAVQGGKVTIKIGIELAEWISNEEKKPWLARVFVNNALNSAANAPEALPTILRLARRTMTYGAPHVDHCNIAWGFMNAGQFEEALDLLNLAVAETPDAGEAVNRLNIMATRAESAASRIDSASQDASIEISKISDDLNTKAQQAGILIDLISSGTINSRFETDAEQNKLQSDRAFKWGLIVLASATAMALLPLVLHYFAVGLKYSAIQVLGAHASATLALGAVAGVLLSRARNRDRARQRASDLATAMGTIIVYSNQIQSPDERQRFMQTMGQLVLVAHLQADQTGAEQASVGLPNLLSALRTPSQ